MELRRMLESVGEGELDEESIARARARLTAEIAAAVEPVTEEPSTKAQSLRSRGRIPQRHGQRASTRTWMPVAASVVLVAAVVGGVSLALAQRATRSPVATEPTASGAPIDPRAIYECGPGSLRGSALTDPRGIAALDEEHAAMAASAGADDSRWIVGDASSQSLLLIAPATAVDVFGADVDFIHLTTSTTAEGEATVGTRTTGQCGLQRVRDDGSAHPYEVAPGVVPTSRALRIEVLSYRCSPRAADYTISRVVETATTIEVTVREEPTSDVELHCAPLQPTRFELTVPLDAPVGDRVVVQPDRLFADDAFAAVGRS